MFVAVQDHWRKLVLEFVQDDFFMCVNLMSCPPYYCGKEQADQAGGAKHATGGWHSLGAILPPDI